MKNDKEKLKKKLSIALAVYNEEENLAKCLNSVRDLVDEIVVVDGGSTDRTVEVAKKYGAKVIVTDNPPIFHINKQKALDACSGRWILQLDADEIVTPELIREIRQVIEMTDEEIRNRTVDWRKKKLFLRHQKIVEKRDGKIGTERGDIVAFFVPRKNYFLGKFLRYAGTYPDGVIRLVKKGKAFFPSETVHEQIQIDGKVQWLYHDLIHFSNPTLKKYLAGASKYTNLLAEKLRSKGVKFGFASALYYFVFKPVATFLNLFLRHKGFLDGIHGFFFSLFSALHYPVAYIKCLR